MTVLNMDKEKVINDAISTYFRKMKQIDFESMTGHLDRMKDKEVEYMLYELFYNVYESGKNSK